jgi:hypothetical protein
VLVKSALDDTRTMLFHAFSFIRVDHMMKTEGCEGYDGTGVDGCWGVERFGCRSWFYELNPDTGDGDEVGYRNESAVGGRLQTWSRVSG